MCVCYPYQSPGTEKAMTDPGVTILTDEGDPDALESSGTSLADFLYPAPAARDSLSIIKWWEKRRWPFNLLVGGAGLTTVGLLFLQSLVLPSNAAGVGRFIWVPIVVFGVMANVCYTLGPAIEIIITKLWGRDVRPVGPALFRMGLTFSLGLALVLPAIIMTIGTLAVLLSRVL